MKTFILIVLLGVAAAAVRHKIDQESNEDWEGYKNKHGKNYKTDAEEIMRRTVWEKNLRKIQHHNIRHSLGKTSFTLGMNKYGDLTSTEFVEMMNGYQQSNTSNTSDRVMFLPPMNANVPDAVDWRTKGYVTRVKNQGLCGSCWAFSAAGSLEGQWFHKTGELHSLSEQNLVDCSQNDGNEGCYGGTMDQAFEYIKENGIETEKDYGYVGIANYCRYDPKKKAASVTGFVNIKSTDEAALTAAIATIGPISVAIDASHDSFQLYKSGVYDEPNCSSDELDHGVLAVGYGSEAAGGDYYIVKNSWSVDWGQKGYILMSRNKNNQCGIATVASYPTV